MQYTDTEAALIGGLISTYFFQPAVSASLKDAYSRVLEHLHQNALTSSDLQQIRKAPYRSGQDHNHHISCGEGDGEGHGRQAVLSDSQDHHPYGGGGHFFSAAGDGLGCQIEQLVSDVYKRQPVLSHAPTFSRKCTAYWSAVPNGRLRNSVPRNASWPLPVC